MNRGLLLLVGFAGACANVLGFQEGELDEGSSEMAGAGESGASGAVAEGGSGSVIPTAGGAPDRAGAGSGDPCGNGELDEQEECDGDELDGATCTTAGDFAGGALSCDAECRYDFEDCYSVESVAVAAHVCAVLSHGKLKCWGANDFGQLGLGDQEHRGEEDGDKEMGVNLPFVPLGEARVQQVTVGARHTCVLTTESEVRCWGDNLDGQLGVPDVELLISAADAPAVDLGPGVVEIQAGSGYTCARFSSGKVKCWGANYVGQLGLGDVRNRGKQPGDLGEQLPFVDLGGLTAEQLSMGEQHTCALGPEGLKCWGATSYNYFWEDPSLYSLGDEPFEMGEDLPRVDLGWDSVAVTSGSWHNCALSLEGSVKCWGDSSAGQLGYGNDEPHLDVTKLAAELGDVDLDGAVLALTAGRTHTCALLTGNRLKCWGGNEWGQLGLGDSRNRGFYEDEMGRRLPAVDLGSDHTIVAVQAGENNNCAILDRGRLKCWGQNDFGALGLGHARPRGSFKDEMGDALPLVELW